MASWKSIALGAAGLAVAEAVVSNPKGAGRLGGFGASIGKVVHDFVAVTVPALPPSKSK